MSTENPIISSFENLDEIRNLFLETRLVVSDGGTVKELDAVEDIFECDPTDIPRLGISLKLPCDGRAFESSATSAKIPLNALEIVVITEDAFLKERDIVTRQTLADSPSNVVVKTVGARRERSLQNSREGVRLTAAIILSRPLDLLPGRPHRLGTKVAGIEFRIRPLPSSGGINPIPLSKETRERHGLTRTTQSFVELNDDLLQADDISTAVRVHIDEELLNALSRRRSGPETEVVQTNLAVTALQQIVFGLSRELNMNTEFDWNETPAPILEFLHSKLQELSRQGPHKTKISREEMIKLIRDNPNTVASLVSGLGNLTRISRLLVSGTDPGEMA